MTAKGERVYVRPFLLSESYLQSTDRAPDDVSNRILRLVQGSSSVITFPFRALVWGILLPLMAVEPVWTLTLRRCAPALAGVVRGVTGFKVHGPRRTAVTPSPSPARKSRGLPNSVKRVTKAVKPSVFATKREVFRVVTVAWAAAKAGAAFPFRSGAPALRRAAGAVIPGLLWGRSAFDRLLFWTFVRPAKIAVSNIVRLACSVDNRARRTTLTISIEGAAVRIVVFRGRQVVAWKSAWIGDEFGPLGGTRAGLADEHRDQVTPSLLKRLIQGEGRRHGRIVVDLPAYTSLIRNLTLTKVARRFLGPIVELELLDSLPFGKKQVDLSWCARSKPSLNNNQLEIFAMAVPRVEIERTAGLFADSRFSPSAAYAKSTTLAYAAGVTNGLIIHFEDNTAAIVPILRGEPWVVHQLTCPRVESSPEAAYSSLARGVEQVEAFSPGRPGLGDAGDDEADHPLVPVVLTGDVCGAGIDPRELEEVLQRPVSTLQTSDNLPLIHPPDFPVAQYASNIGLFLADRAGIKPWQAASRSKKPRKIRRIAPPGLNVLPQRHLPPPLPPLLVPIFIALLLAAAGTVPFWDKTNTMVAGAKAMEVQLDSLKGQAKERRSLVDRELVLTGKLDAASGEAAALESRLKETQRHMQTLLARLDAITYDPQSHGVSLFGVNPETGGFSISGTAETHADVLRYAQAVRDSGHFGDARITGLEGLGKEAGGRITFRILAMELGAPQDVDGQASSLVAPVITP